MYDRRGFWEKGSAQSISPPVLLQKNVAFLWQSSSTPPVKPNKSNVLIDPPVRAFLLSVLLFSMAYI
jgi:hypothetical protein